jgi:hypothetical protein
MKPSATRTLGTRHVVLITHDLGQLRDQVDGVTYPPIRHLLRRNPEVLFNAT